jgi:O-methyltransferase involved in polyketide biosynthesis
MENKFSISLTGVPETLLIPLYVRAKESRRPDAMQRDDIAVAVIDQLDYDFTRIKLQGHDELGIILRLREFDRFARDFLTAHPDGVIVHIGCGLDTRFERVDNGGVEWYDLDLPDVIELHRKLVGEQGGRYHF